MRSPSSGNDDYWGEKAGLDEIIFRTISDGNTRKQELRGRLDRRLRPGRARVTSPTSRTRASTS
ncbi:MAG: hypothetical protein WKF47_02910 [Geodermatophilaceae bacterium]